MDKIPVSFSYKNRQYTGTLSKVLGAGSTSTYFLDINGFHLGQLFLSGSDNKWKFHSNQEPGMSELEDYFGRVVEAAVQ